MRLLFYCGGSYVYGAELLLLAVMRELSARGHDVRCMISGWNDGDWPARLEQAGIASYTAKLGFVYVRKPLWTLDTLVHWPGAYLYNARVHRAFRPHLTVHHDRRSIIMLPGLITPERTVLYHVDMPVSRGRIRDFFALRLGRARFHLTCSTFVADRLRAVTGDPALDVRVSYPIVDPAVSAPARPASGEVRIGIVGQVIERKGHQDLVAALARVPDEPRWSLHVYGGGEPRVIDALRAQAERAGLSDRVVLHGFVADRDAIYGALDLVVVPTRDEEPFGLAAAEPALRGLPVIATRSGGLAEIVRDGVTGRLVERGDVPALAGALAALIADAKARRQLGEAGREHVQERFTAARAVAAFETALTAVGER